MTLIDLSLFRALMLLILSVILAKRFGVQLITVPSNARGALLARAVVGQMDFLTRTLSIMLIPLGTLIVLFNTNTVFASLLAFFFLGE